VQPLQNAASQFPSTALKHDLRPVGDATFQFGYPVHNGPAGDNWDVGTLDYSASCSGDYHPDEAIRYPGRIGSPVGNRGNPPVVGLGSWHERAKTHAVSLVDHAVGNTPPTKDRRD
jgi:hypothetical protein